MIESAKNEHSCENNFLKSDLTVHHNANKAKWVLIITAATMFVEIIFGYKTGSMALLADGWHMASHAAALGITYLAYKLAVNARLTKNFNFGGGKIIALGGFTSSIILLFVVILVGFESISRFLNPRAIQFDEALFVAIFGLIINFVCAYILRDNHTHSHHGDHHHHEHGEHVHNHHDHFHDHNKDSSLPITPAANRDHNIQGAYLHV
ncbi:MAG: cation diffusion facilitator family transporter, partial [Bdellovibrionales bacterium]